MCVRLAAHFKRTDAPAETNELCIQNKTPHFNVPLERRKYVFDCTASDNTPRLMIIFKFIFRTDAVCVHCAQYVQSIIMHHQWYSIVASVISTACHRQHAIIQFSLVFSCALFFCTCAKCGPDILPLNSYRRAVPGQFER